MYRIIYCFLKTIPISLAGIIQPPTLSRTLTGWAALLFQSLTAFSGVLHLYKKSSPLYDERNHVN